ncbi:M12 family metallo-peptidase [Actinocrispum wychmicini]|uniref:Reprolysin-like metallo-peptidase family M12B n=1 Tax=Actinocrispum wychmicini TaxID=1213861 RepID=A0A4R2JCP8_9PSEU|nr:M12 family metallo-peptidase [Actinocrispum wychmicini]TCO57361.1 reprolysin-like metallo-peptidase family M12B [Actinocrispum wychmicini]
MRPIAALAAAVTVVALIPFVSTAESDNPWTRVDRPSVAARSARPADIRTDHFAGFTLDRPVMSAKLVPSSTQVILPTPEGTFQRFTLADAPVMEAGLAAAHPEIRTYSGRGVDDPTATVRADLTPLGFHASVRSQRGQWFVDPYYHADQSLYASYYGHDVTSAGPLVEHEEVGELLQDLAPLTAGPVVKLRTYRVALVTDPSYATFFGAENVTAAKVTLMNRVAQVYEDETAIRLVLINGTDKINLNTAEQAIGANGPCGAAPCYTPAQLASCSGSTLSRNRIVLGQLIGASNYDVGHIGLGVNGGGIASLGVVGGNNKAQGCTGLPTPVGDFYAVDYVAHEMGHQFAGNHTFNGTQVNCSGGNRNGANSVEPGSGSSIMAYAGICQQDNLQPHSDPYWSQRSYTEITTYINSARPAINEVQTVSLTGFDGTDSVTLSFGGATTAPIVRGTNYSSAGIKAALEALPTWPAGVTATVAGFGNLAFDDTGFQVTFSGATKFPSLELAVTGASGFVGETAKGGAQDNGGNQVTDTTNHAPVVTVPSAFTIPVRTPFSLSGSATDADGDSLTYLWEQNDRGAAAGTALVSNTKTAGPLFRQFGTAAVVSATDTLKYYSPGENTINGDTTRVFPDYPQIAVNNTNAKTGTCPAAPPVPAAVPADLLDCYSEFLPTPDWVGFDASRTMHFRLTARDGRPGGGGIGSADTALTLAPSAGPFLVTSQGTSSAYTGGSTQTVTWDVAGTADAPVGVSAVKISFSTDGGLTYPYVLSESTPNNGTATVTVPDVATTHGRIKVEAVGNVFFDLNDTDITVHATPRVTLSGNTTVQYSDASPVTITATDPDTAAAGLTAVATGLPTGLSLTGSAGTWSLSGTVSAPPGDYPVSIAVTDDTGGVRTASFVLKVIPEDATATYTGDSLVFGNSVLLRATVQDNTDATPGNILTGNVTFALAGQPLCSSPLHPLGTGDATGSCTAMLPNGPGDVTVSVGGNYTGTAVATVETAKPQNRVAVIAGALTSTGSAGTYPADPGSKVDVNVAVAYLKALSGASGVDLVTFKSGGNRYTVVGTNVASFGARTGVLDLRGQATVFDGSGHRVASGTLRITAHGNAVAVTLLDGDTLVFSSGWTGAKTQENPLTHGIVLII